MRAPLTPLSVAALLTSDNVYYVKFQPSRCLCQVAYPVCHLATSMLSSSQDTLVKALANTLNPITAKHGEIKPSTVSFTSVEHLARCLSVDASTILDLMGIPQRTRSRRRQDGILKADEADRLLRIARVFSEAIRVFGSEEKARLWLKTP